ncbi:MAG: protein arginine kinase, partial [bacterium]|nr:protein arginine kinase [bacterium]
DGSGHCSGLVISSRVRLARNLLFARFAGLADEDEQRRVVEAVVPACQEGVKNMAFFDAGALTEAQRQVLVERHLISPALAQGHGCRGVLVDPDEVFSVMVNEEDHLRIQVMQSGFQAHRAWEAARRLSREFSDRLEFAYSEKWGYLTACPTNAGTGLRVSILIHLPGLVLTQEIDSVIRGVTQMGCTVRGLYGEGSEVSGNLFQVSNQVTLGRTEEEILEALEKIATQIIEYEENARETLIGSIRTQIEDKIWRAFGILSHARLLTSQEFMNLSSAVRLGIGLGLFRTLDAGVLNEMMVKSKPFHLQEFEGRELDSDERDRIRAEMTRRRMSEIGTP